MKVKQTQLCSYVFVLLLTGSNTALKVSAFSDYIAIDVPYNGDCFFACLALALKKNSADDVRHELVDFLMQHPCIVSSF
jgi:hypothetical protein